VPLGISHEAGAAPASDLSETELLRDTAQRLFSSGPSLETVGQVGFISLLTPERLGGAGWLPREACIVAEEGGRALTPLPWTSNLLAGAALSGDHRWDKAAMALLEGRIAASLVSMDRLGTERGRFQGRVLVSADPRPAILVLLSEYHQPVVVDTQTEKVEFEPSTSPDTTRPAATAILRDVAGHSTTGTQGPLLWDAAVVLACADSLGALSNATALVKEHLSNRMAFDRQLTSFQTLQHRLANLTILEAACSAMIRRAATVLSGPPAYRTRVVQSTHLYFARRVPRAIDDCLQLAGGLGFTWDFPLHHAMRRAMANSHSIRSHRHGLDHTAAGPPPVDTDNDPFRTRAQRIIRERAPFEIREGHRAPTTPDQEAALRSWYRTLYESGLVGGSWPVEWGGDPEHQPRHDLIAIEELIRARAPRPVDQVQLASHVILAYGTEAQKARYLPRIRTAADIWCQLFSEPDCGSDLAGIKARATLRGDGLWTLSGQKTWTTDAHWAEMGLALLRTSVETRRHDGLTAFLVPMNSSGLEVRPKMTIGGAYEFNDVFLDGVVLDPAQVIGPIGRGWEVAMSGLEVERFGVGGNVLLLELLLWDLVSLAQNILVGGSPLLDRMDVRNDIAALGAEAAAARAFVDDLVTRWLHGEEAPADASIAKILYSETYNSIAMYGSEFVMEHLPVPQESAPYAQRLIDAWLWSRALTISGGSSEIMRNVIAKRRLGLSQ
jgi:alkylation response protein AidB-like acyl-CoA dehydrogenase